MDRVLLQRERAQDLARVRVWCISMATASPFEEILKTVCFFSGRCG